MIKQKEMASSRGIEWRAHTGAHVKRATKSSLIWILNPGVRLDLILFNLTLSSFSKPQNSMNLTSA